MQMRCQQGDFPSRQDNRDYQHIQKNKNECSSFSDPLCRGNLSVPPSC